MDTLTLKDRNMTLILGLTGWGWGGVTNYDDNDRGGESERPGYCGKV